MGMELFDKAFRVYGLPDMVSFMFSYLFAAERHLFPAR